MYRQEVEVNVKNIKWLPEEDGLETDESLTTQYEELPTEKILTVEIQDYYKMGEIAESIALTLTEYYGFLIEDFDFEVIPF
jgi:hypothetical protein